MASVSLGLSKQHQQLSSFYLSPLHFLANDDVINNNMSSATFTTTTTTPFSFPKLSSSSHGPNLKPRPNCALFNNKKKPVIVSSLKLNCVKNEKVSPVIVNESEGLSVGVGSAYNMRRKIVGFRKFSLGDQAFFVLAFIAGLTSVALATLVMTAVPTFYAMGRAAVSLSKLTDVVREELPSTMAAIRLSGMEISDLTLELSDLSHEISSGVHKSANAVKTAEAGIRHMGSTAHEQTMAIIHERAALPIISIQPVVAGAARKTSNAVGIATKSLMNMINGDESDSKIEE